MKDNGQIPPVDIYIDSPMAVEATKVFMQNPECFDDEVSGIIKGKGAASLFTGKDIHYVLSTEESIALNKVKSGAIIISASGMADAGRIKHHLKHNLWRPECTVLFVGYQAEGTLGRRILDGEDTVRIHGEQIAVNATIERIDDFSAHADQEGLLEWLKGFEKAPAQVILVHGEEDALDTLQRLIVCDLKIETKIAEYGMIYDLKMEEPIMREVELPAAASAAAVASMIEPNLTQAFMMIKDRIILQAKQRCDTKVLQRLLAQLAEIERELRRVG
jgi:metallo-beta-lactamase family protein